MSKAICSECRYIYDSKTGLPESGILPGTHFRSADDSIFECPHCGSSKDVFIELEEVVVEVDDPKDLGELEAQHVPVYKFENDELVVSVGEIGVEHPQDVDHMIEWIGLFDESGEMFDCVYFHPNDEVVAYFSVDSDEYFEVRAGCSEHGIWKGIQYEDTGL